LAVGYSPTARARFLQTRTKAAGTPFLNRNRMTALAEPPTAPPTARASGLLVSSLPAWLASAADMEGELAGVEVFGGKLGYIVRQLERVRVDFFFPRERVRRHGRGEYDRAFIPGCFFIGGGFDGREAARDYASFMGWRVKFLRPVGDAAQAQLRKEVADLGSLLDADPTLRAWQGLRGGDRCRVVQGPFLGAEGFVDCEGKRARLWVRLTIFGRSTSVEVPIEYLERL